MIWVSIGRYEGQVSFPGARMEGGCDAEQGGSIQCTRRSSQEIKEVVDPANLSPYDEHFYPPGPIGRGSTSSRKLGQPMHAITSIPYADQVIQPGMIDEWDYCLRRLFVLKSTKLADALK